LTLDSPTLAAAAGAIHLGRVRRHVLLCTFGKCAPAAEAEASWKYLKRRLKELGLVDVDGAVLRTRANCLRICRDGPIALVYPEGTWYHHATPENLEQALDNWLDHKVACERLRARYAAIHAQLRCGNDERVAQALAPWLGNG